MTWFWFLMMIVFGLLEAATVSLVSVWFVGGAFGALIVNLLGARAMIQWLVFTLISVGLLAAVRPMVRNVLQRDVTQTNAPALIGKKVLVTEHIDNIRGTGAVKVNGVLWTARSAFDMEIEEGTLVQIGRIEGAKLLVYPVDASDFNDELN